MYGCGVAQPHEKPASRSAATTNCISGPADASSSQSISRIQHDVPTLANRRSCTNRSDFVASCDFLSTCAPSPKKAFLARPTVALRHHSLPSLIVFDRAMTAPQLFVLGLFAGKALASPRNLFARGQEGSFGSPGHSNDGSWGQNSDSGAQPSDYGSSWDNAMTSTTPHAYTSEDHSGWEASATCSPLTIYQTSVSTVPGSTSTVYLSGSVETSFLPASTLTVGGSASTVYLSGKDHTSFLPASTVTLDGSASTVYISGKDHTSFLPGSTITAAGPAHTSVITAYETVKEPAAPTTIYITQQGLGYNHTITREETELITTTQYEYSTRFNDETTTMTSVLTLPGRTSRNSSGLMQGRR